MTAAKYLIQVTENNPNSDKFFEMIKQFNESESGYKFREIDGQRQTIDIYKNGTLKGSIDRGDEDLDSKKH